MNVYPQRPDSGHGRLSPLYMAVTALATLSVASLFFGSARLQTLYADYWSDPSSWMNDRAGRLGPWSAPLDDVFIHFDFARSAARGHPFEWAAGNGYSSGATSLTYPLVLSLGYLAGLTGLDLMEWAGIVACMSVFGFLLGAQRLFRGLPPFTAYLAPAAVLGIGALSWSLFSGMEVALFLAVWAGAFVVWDRIERSAGESTRLVLGAAGLLGVCGALLVGTRPEGLITAGVLALFAAFSVRSRGLPCVLAVFALAVGPALLVVLAQSVANLLLTGEVAAAGAVAKLEIYHPFLSAREKLDLWLFYLSYQLLRVTHYHLQTLPGAGWLVWVFAVLALGFRETRLRAALLWVSLLTWSMAVATNGQVRWQNERYTMPAVAWLMLAAALGAAAVLARAWDAPKNKTRLGLAAATLGLVAFFAWQAAPALRFQAWFFGRGARNIYDQQVRTGRLLRDDFDPPPQRVLVGDAGAIQFITDGPALDIIGLGGYRGMPFARATREHVGAAVELIERLHPHERPDLFAIYPSWWDDFPVWFGQWLTEVPARGNVICGAPSKVLYRAKWAPLEGSAVPFELAPGERIVAELDFADVISEAAANYRRDPEAQGRVAQKMLAHPRRPRRDVFDAGRHTPPGIREYFELDGLTPGRPLRLLVRAAPTNDAEVPVLVAGRKAGVLSFAKRDGWVELGLELEPPEGDTISIELARSEERVLYHLWLLERP